MFILYWLLLCNNTSWKYISTLLKMLINKRMKSANRNDFNKSIFYYKKQTSNTHRLPVSSRVEIESWKLSLSVMTRGRLFWSFQTRFEGTDVMGIKWNNSISTTRGRSLCFCSHVSGCRWLGFQDVSLWSTGRRRTRRLWPNSYGRPAHNGGSLAPASSKLHGGSLLRELYTCTTVKLTH